MNIELNDPAITAKGLQSILGFYKTLSVESRQLNTKAAIAFYTGINSPFLNPVFDLRNKKRASDALLQQIEDFYADKSAPWAYFIFPSTGDNDLLGHSYSLVEEAPSMYFNLQTPIQLREINGLHIKEEKQQSNLENWFTCIEEGFGVVDNDQSYRLLNAKLLNTGNKHLRHFTAYINNEPAAAATLYLDTDSVMIHNLATKNSFRKQGIGSYLTVYMMGLASELGLKHCYLDASAEAFNLYKRLGFSVYATTKIYTKT